MSFVFSFYRLWADLYTCHTLFMYWLCRHFKRQMCHVRLFLLLCIPILSETLFYVANRPPHGFPLGMPRMQPPGFHREMMIPHEGMMPPFDMGKIDRYKVLL